MAQLRLRLAAAIVTVAAVGGACSTAAGFEFNEATVDTIQLGFRNGSLTSTALVRFYLNQIVSLNPLLHAVIEVNPDAVAQAARADAERASDHRCCGPLHGVPILLKDNIATRDKLNTTAGSLALLGSVVRRDAGAVILGKANPSEWSHFRGGLPSGWSARGGQTRVFVELPMKNPYVLSATPCGSSSGSGVAAAANMASVTLGTETDGSILCPASLNSVVGIKPTVGLTSRSGVIPITPRQDTVGPMCRTVSDAVHVLDSIAGYDALDAEATGAASKYIPVGGYGQFLRMDGLRGKRIGIPNGFFTKEKYGKKQLWARNSNKFIVVYLLVLDNDKLSDTFRLETTYSYTNTHHLLTHLLHRRKHGAMVIENIDIIENLTLVKDHLFEIDLVAMRAEFKLSLNAYLSDLLYSPVRSLADVIAFNNAHPVKERLKGFGQSILIDSEKTNGIASQEKAVLEILNEISTDGLEKLMKKHQLDAIVTPNNDASGFFAIGGMPAITVPAGYNRQGVPFGICFGGLKGYEPRLIEMAYAFEQATKVRRMPRFKGLSRKL
uniref:Amidase domain-containing protein n=1 Tax=Oryza punctata TaxID=4537 RepID=A0A0E0KMX9_ORYPU